MGMGLLETGSLTGLASLIPPDKAGHWRGAAAPGEQVVAPAGQGCNLAVMTDA